MTRRLLPMPAPSDMAGFMPGFGKSAIVRALHAERCSPEEIAAHLSLPVWYVRRAVRELPPPKPAPKRVEIDDDLETFVNKWYRSHCGKRGEIHRYG